MFGGAARRGIDFGAAGRPLPPPPAPPLAPDAPSGTLWLCTSGSHILDSLTGVSGIGSRDTK